MQIRFKDGTKKPCYNPTETMLFRDGKKVAWLFSFVIPASSIEIDEILTQDNISDIFIESNDEKYGYRKGGYDTVNSVSITYDEIGGMAEVQLKRSINNEADKE